jgi:crotonobetainyl-CoA:carnitine CoA-transferase CaiB-like acyl-CoA transferase
METIPPLDGTFRVLDLSDGIAGAYCTKVLADAGAEVTMVEPPGGRTLRNRSAGSGPVDPIYGSAFFQFLTCSKSSVVVDLGNDDDLELIDKLVSDADAIVWSENSQLCANPRLSVEALRSKAPHALVLALTGYGLTGPWAGRPSNEFVWQALAGSAWNHGSCHGEPVMIGGASGDYAQGTVGALGILFARTRAAHTGHGELIDVAGLEVLQLTHSMFPVTFLDMTGRPYRTERSDPIPGIHRTTDGWVGLWVTTGQQWLDFCTLTERFDWLEDPSLGNMNNRSDRHDELVGVIDAWAAARTTAEIIEYAELLRIPVAPIGNGEHLPTFDHYVERDSYTRHPRTGVTQPDVWYSMSNGARRRAFEPSPGLGEHTPALRSGGARTRPKPPAAAPATGDGSLPFTGLRIADMTAFWAGPIISHSMAMLGADVIHIESTKRPDGIRMATTWPMSKHGWWETSPFFNGTNTCKRDLAVDLQTDQGREVMHRLLAECDVLIENYSPRVMAQLGLDYETVSKIRPDIIMVRAPAFGTSGPWRDRVGYAPTIDQASGLAWITGVPDGKPLMIGAASDAVGGLHGCLAIQFALDYRRRTGKGMLIESPQIGPGLNISAEQVVTYSADGVVLGRIGNRSWVHAPQGVYRALDHPSAYQGVPADDWVAISIETDSQWSALCTVVGDAALMADSSLRTVEGRRGAHDRIDAVISAWCASRDSLGAARVLCEGGVPAARVVPPHEFAEIETLVARGFYETVHQPVAGEMRIVGFPIRFSSGPERWHHAPAPCLGEHNREILEGLLGMSRAEVDQLEADGIIGAETTVNLGW